MTLVAQLAHHYRVITALSLREMSTRFGREGLGFAWLILEPLAFCVGVLLLWTMTKPTYEHGVRVAPFVMTGYMCIILMRHQVSFSVTAIQANIGLLHHRLVKPVHLLLTRNLLEFGGATAAFILVYVALIFLGEVSLPNDYLLLYAGWALLGWVGMGFALLLAGLSMRFELVERVVPLLTYILIPLSGAFFMVGWLPPDYREIVLILPFVHPIEMVRGGVFGEFVKVYYDAFYAFAVGTGLNITGLLLIFSSRHLIDVE
jgi:capsular polysaccharide transport system permease protein